MWIRHFKIISKLAMNGVCILLSFSTTYQAFKVQNAKL